MAWRALGDRAWLFEAAAAHDGARHAMVLAMARRIEAEQIPGVRDVVPSFDTLATHFEDPGQGERTRGILESLTPDVDASHAGEREPLRVPVAYGGDHGPDLDQAAATLGLASEAIARIHFEATYTVAAVGFSPGFPYLTGLPERQTIGGYPQIGHVISADLPRLARAWPGAKLQFREVTLEAARAAWSELRRELALLETGLLLRGS